MGFAKSLFVAIDKVFKLPQNPKRLLKKLTDVQCVNNICYDEKFPDMMLDLYLPQVQEKAPVIFEIHGGGFAAGDKKYRDCLCKYMAEHTGAAVVNVNYGVGKENACPLPMQHLTSALNWVAQNADNYHFDLSRLVATGDSAGAFYACFLAVLQDSEQLQSLFECTPCARITATVLNCGVYNLVPYLKKKTPITKGISLELLGVPLEQAAQNKYLPGMNLLPFVTEKFPPSFVIYAKKDVFCKGQGEQLLAKMTEAGVAVESVHSTMFKDNHTYSLTWNSKMAKLTNEKMLEFLKEHFDKRV